MIDKSLPNLSRWRAISMNGIFSSAKPYYRQATAADAMRTFLDEVAKPLLSFAKQVGPLTTGRCNAKHPRLSGWVMRRGWIVRYWVGFYVISLILMLVHQSSAQRPSFTIIPKLLMGVADVGRISVHANLTRLEEVREDMWARGPVGKEQLCLIICILRACPVISRLQPSVYGLKKGFRYSEFAVDGSFSGHALVLAFSKISNQHYDDFSCRFRNRPRPVTLCYPKIFACAPRWASLSSQVSHHELFDHRHSCERGIHKTVHQFAHGASERLHQRRTIYHTLGDSSGQRTKSGKASAHSRSSIGAATKSRH